MFPGVAVIFHVNGYSHTGVLFLIPSVVITDTVDFNLSKLKADVFVCLQLVSDIWSSLLTNQNPHNNYFV